MNQGRKHRQQQADEAADRARGVEMEEMQMGMMRQEMDIAQRQAAATEAAAKSAAPMAKKYMDMWNKSLSTTTGMFNKAMEGVDRGWAAIKTMQDNKVDFSKISADLESEWESIKGKFGGLSDQAIEMAGEEMTQRRQLGKQLSSLAQPDYEGVAGRAMADVTGQAEKGRQSEQRRMASLGIDPTSGRGRSAMNTIQAQETLAKATAATAARRGEKERVGGAAERAMELIDPSKTFGVAKDIQGLKSDILGQRVGVGEAQVRQGAGIAGAIGAMSGAAGNIARGMGETVTSPLGEAAGVYSGMAMQGGYDPISGKAAGNYGRSAMGTQYTSALQARTGAMKRNLPSNYAGSRY
jgi:hypothetical protein